MYVALCIVQSFVQCAKVDVQYSLCTEVVEMTDRDDRSRLHVEIPVETKQALKDADGPMWQLINDGVRMALGLDEGSTEAAIEQRLEEMRKERSEVSAQAEALHKRLDELDAMEEELEDRLANIREKKASHKERLDDVLDAMCKDERQRQVIAHMQLVRDAAMHEYGSDSKNNIDRVISDLRKRATEQGRDIMPSRFSRTPPAGPSTAQAANDGGEDDDFRVLNGDNDE